MDGKNVHLEMRKLKQTELLRLEERKVEDKTRTYENTRNNAGHSQKIEAR